MSVYWYLTRVSIKVQNIIDIKLTPIFTYEKSHKNDCPAIEYIIIDG